MSKKSKKKPDQFRCAACDKNNAQGRYMHLHGVQMKVCHPCADMIAHQRLLERIQSVLEMVVAIVHHPEVTHQIDSLLDEIEYQKQFSATL